MKDRKKISRFFSKEVWMIVIVIAVSSISWWSFRSHPIDHESFLYFYSENKPYNENWLVVDGFYVGYENNFARLLFGGLIRVLDDNIYLQVIPFFIIISLVHSAYFIMAKKFTNIEIAFVAALLFSVNVSGAFEMYNHSRYFFERIPQFFFVFISIYYWIRYTKCGGMRDYTLSFVLYILAVFMGHFASLFAPVYVFLVAFSSPFKKNEYWHKLLSVIPILLVVYLLIRNSPLGPNFVRSGDSFLSIFETADWFRQYTYQIVGVTTPKALFYFLSRSYWNVTPVVASNRLIVPVIFFYFSTAIYLLRKHSRFNQLVLVSLSYIFSFPIVNIYLNRVNFKNELDGSRYFWIIHIFVFLYFAVVLNSMCKRNNIGKMVSLIIVVTWLFTNYNWINRLEKDTQWEYRAITETTKQIEKLSYDLGAIRYIGIPPHVQIGPLSFFDNYYIYGRARMLPSEDILKNYSSYDSSEVVVFGYNQNKGSYDANTFVVAPIDITLINQKIEGNGVPDEDLQELIYSI